MHCIKTLLLAIAYTHSLCPAVVFHSPTFKVDMAPFSSPRQPDRDHLPAPVSHLPAHYLLVLVLSRHTCFHSCTARDLHSGNKFMQSCLIITAKCLLEVFLPWDAHKKLSMIQQLTCCQMQLNTSFLSGRISFGRGTSICSAHVLQDLWDRGSLFHLVG